MATTLQRCDRIHGLDGIRAIAFLLVLCGHCGLPWVPPGFGVTVFFFLSGYLITTLLRKEWIQTGEISISQFYIRRAFRILPPVYCAMALAVGAAYFGILHTRLDWRGIAAIPLFLTNYAELLPRLTVPLGLSPLWSLAVEEHFYLLFPLLYLALQKAGLGRSRQAAWLGAGCLASLIWRVLLMAYFHVDWNRVYIGTDTRLDSILFGAIMAIAANPAIDALPKITRRQCAAAASLSLAVLLASIAARGELFRQTVRYSIQGLALAPVFFYIVRYPDSRLTRWLDCRFLTRIGSLSYALYVFHYTVMFSVQTWVTQNAVVTLALTFTITVALAELSQRLIENPAARTRNRILLRRRAGTAATTMASLPQGISMPPPAEPLPGRIPAQLDMPPFAATSGEQSR